VVTQSNPNPAPDEKKLVKDTPELSIRYGRQKYLW